MHFRDFTHPEDVGQDLRFFEELVDGKRESYELEVRYLGKGGGTGWVRLTVSLVRGPDGEPQFAIGMTEDITEHKRAEQRLREAQKMEVVGRLVGGVAHDFNNLLTGIMLYSDLLVAGLGKDVRLRRHAEQIRLAAEQGAVLIQQLLAISRQQIIEPRILCLNQTVAGARNLLARLIGENIELRLQLEERLGKLKTENRMLREKIKSKQGFGSIVGRAPEMAPGNCYPGVRQLRDQRHRAGGAGDPHSAAPPAPGGARRTTVRRARGVERIERECHGPAAFLRPGALGARSADTGHSEAAADARVGVSDSDALGSFGKSGRLGITSTRGPLRADAGPPFCLLNSLPFLARRDFPMRVQLVQNCRTPSFGSLVFSPCDARDLRCDFGVEAAIGLGHEDRPVDKLEHRQIIAAVTECDSADLRSPCYSVEINQHTEGEALVASGS
jgi:hypothetical protein